MALQLPGFASIQPYDQNPDIIGKFAKGYGLSTDIINEADAKKTLADYAASLYGKAPQPAGAPTPPSTNMSLLDLAQSGDAGNRMIGAEQASAEGAVDPALAGYFASTARNESGGSNTATNPNSSATGKYQFLDATWQDLMKRHPELGLTPDGRTDPAQQDRAMPVFTRDNATVLKASGVPINPGTLYAAHFLGGQGAADALSLPDNTPMTSAVPPDVLAVNPNLSGMTVGQFKQWTAQQGGNGNGGYQGPLAQQPQQQPADLGIPQGGNGLPSRDVMIALMRNPDTRAFGAQLLQRASDPSFALDIAGKRADIGLKEAQAAAWAGGLKTGGYRPNGDGTASYVPGSQADPNNPLNFNKTGGGAGQEINKTRSSRIIFELKGTP